MVALLPKVKEVVEFMVKAEDVVRVVRALAVIEVVPERVVVALVNVVLVPKVIRSTPSDPAISLPFILKSSAIVNLPAGVSVFEEEKN
jgi:hypothetical protein